MIKKVKKWGNTLVIMFNKEEQEVYNIKEGDKLDLSDLVNLGKTQLNKKNLKGGKK